MLTKNRGIDTPEGGVAGGVASCGVLGFVSNSLGSDESSDLMSKLFTTIPVGFLWHSVQWRRNLETGIIIIIIIIISIIISGGGTWRRPPLG